MRRLPSWVRMTALGLGLTTPSVALYACSSDTPVVTPPSDAQIDSRVGVDVAVSVDANAKDASGDRDPCAVTTAPLCSPTATWGAPVAVFSSGPRHFAAITPDELHVAWYEGANGGDGGTDGGVGVLGVADRASPSASFGTPTMFAEGVDLTGAGLAPDGLLLVVTRNGRPAIAPRALGAGFGALSTTGLNFGDETTFRAPAVVSNGGFFLTLELASVGQVPFTFISKLGPSYRQDELLLPHRDLLVASPDNLVPRPTGMSNDLRTLFFYDELKKIERAAFRAGPGCAFTTVVDVGNLPGAMPNADCTALYYADPNASGSDVARVARTP